MNYIRGAVYAISAPYQYYKELAPLNPSTLTGAIDVIVVRRPVEDGTDVELISSPFHVRFGKWQVLRPADKKVNLTVNGKHIPFNMKIGEAGEAFFIFETAGDVPEELITSPLLEATRSPDIQREDAQPGRFGANEGRDQDVRNLGQLPQSEPDFLDLNAPSTPPASSQPDQISVPEAERGDGKDTLGPSSLLSHTTALGASIGHAILEKERDEYLKAKERTKAAYRTTQDIARRRTIGPDDISSESVPHEPIYNDDAVLDMEGYHSHHRKDQSDRTVTASNERGDSTSSSSPDLTPGPSRPGTPPLYGPSSSSPTIHNVGLPLPTIRATSEPPPDMEEENKPPSAIPSHTRHLSRSLNIPTLSGDEYLWEWGSFPQKSPLKTTFGPPGISEALSAGWDKDKATASRGFNSKTEDSSGTDLYEEEGGYGTGGRLRPDRNEPYRFILLIERKTTYFELALFPKDESRRKFGRDEVDDAQIFNERRIEYKAFLDDESIFQEGDLVIRWAGDRYITRSDGSPLMGALSKWRHSTLKHRNQGTVSRSPSPAASITSDYEEPLSSGDEGAKDVPQVQNARTTSLSWIRWWNRSQRTRASSEQRANEARPAVSERSSEPLDTKQTFTESDPAALLRTASTASAPPVISTGVSTTEVTQPQEKKPSRKYAKTLRLTSDQLKQLDLKPGANTITFSLSASGVVACTARIFVWDHTDLIVVSDIDGTITKSDALGHVFTMIGRDWTHLGVAKLYTDICRNGYKIMYLTSRAIGQADSTRYYLKGVKQNDYQLPEGPVIMSPDRLMASLHREVIMRKPEVFKMACLRDIRRLFGKTSANPFYAGFGNRITDALSYRSVDVPSSRIFTINSVGEVKMELLELAGYKSSYVMESYLLSSFLVYPFVLTRVRYIHMTDLVDQMFPPVHRHMDAHFTDFNFWRPPMDEDDLPELTPPSPALSARSDTSNQSTLARLRNMSLMGSGMTGHKKQFSLPPPKTESSIKGASKAGGEGGRGPGSRNPYLRQMSSFERLSNTLSNFVPSTSSNAASPISSPSVLDSGDEDEDLDLEWQTRGRIRIRRTSMPGSLPGNSDDERDEHERGDEEGGEDEEEDDYGYDAEHEEQTFDDDIFATGEMENVPFL
ncbi:LNS2-domain-containing protein [Thelephora ganbajun]|uniref:LNS2-domain-containing protein n=1 Tax=Thelephora ganbajun TaxID=370292 RepID=A0ACB6ZQH9_THEGA|nr:LNS2-domain-containing protein [Thelephora ganbajun]